MIKQALNFCLAQPLQLSAPSPSKIINAYSRLQHSIRIASPQPPYHEVQQIIERHNLDHYPCADTILSQIVTQQKLHPASSVLLNKQITVLKSIA